MARNNQQIVQRFLDAAMSGDRDTMNALMSPDALVVEAESLPYGGSYRGVPGFRELVRRVYSAFSDVAVTVEGYVAGNDQVIVMATLSGKTRKNGTPFDMPVLEAWRLDGGRIIEIRPFYFDTARMNMLAAS